LASLLRKGVLWVSLPSIYGIKGIELGEH